MGGFREGSGDGNISSAEEEGGDGGGGLVDGREVEGCYGVAGGSESVSEEDWSEEVGETAIGEEEGVEGWTIEVLGDLKEELIGEGEEWHCGEGKLRFAMRDKGTMSAGRS